MLRGLLTVGRQVALAVAREEVVAFALALELGRELLGGHLVVGHVADLLILHWIVDLLCFEYLLIDSRFPERSCWTRPGCPRIRIMRFPGARLINAVVD